MGVARDVDDVLALLSSARITREELAAAFAEIVPRLEQESVRTDEEDFRRKFAAFNALAEQQQHQG
jgi:hypothetical protein